MLKKKKLQTSNGKEEKEKRKLADIQYLLSLYGILDTVLDSFT